MGDLSKIKSDKFTFYTFQMTLCIVFYHTAPHLLIMAGMGGYDRNFFETLGPIALNYFFATSAYFFFSSDQSFASKMGKRIKSLCVPFAVWNTLYIPLYVLRNDIPNLSEVILGYTLEPFDGPLWYIFVLYIFFGLSYYIDRAKNRSPKGLMVFALLISICAASFHQIFVAGKVSFLYDYWIERTVRMIPAYLFGAYYGKRKEVMNPPEKAKTIIMAAAIISWGLAIHLGDCFATILLLYACTACLWFGCPDIKFKPKSILYQSTFLIYALHEGVIIVLLAVMSKTGLSNAVTNRIYFIGCFLMVVFLILEVAVLMDKIVEKCPLIISNLLTGGRSKANNKRKN